MPNRHRVEFLSESLFREPALYLHSGMQSALARRKIMSLVFQSCITFPLRTVLIFSALGFGISSAVTRHGPRGQKVANVFAAAPLTTAAIHLPVTSTYVIGAGIAQDVIQSICFGNVVTSLSNHNSQLAFVVNFVTAKFARQHDRIAWVLNCRRDLHEQNRMRRNRLFAFFRMLTIVQPDAQKRPRDPAVASKRDAETT